MTLKECYERLDGNYEEVIGRLRTERLVEKILLKFPKDESYELLCRSMEQKSYEEAFRGAHTIKGVCQNMSFSRLGESSGLLTEALRNGYTPEAEDLFARVKEDYQKVIRAIDEYQAEKQ